MAMLDTAGTPVRKLTFVAVGAQTIVLIIHNAMSWPRMVGRGSKMGIG